MLSFGNAARKETNLQQDGYHTHTVANTVSNLPSALHDFSSLDNGTCHLLGPYTRVYSALHSFLRGLFHFCPDHLQINVPKRAQSLRRRPAPQTCMHLLHSHAVAASRCRDKTSGRPAAAAHARDAFSGLDSSTQSLTGVLVFLPSASAVDGSRIVWEASVNFQDRLPHYHTTSGVIKDGAVVPKLRHRCGWRL